MPHDPSMPSAGPGLRRPAMAPPRTVARAGWRRVWFRIHGLIGLTAGTVLLVIGLTGATLAFRDEITDAIDPGVRQVAVRDLPVLTPGGIVAAVTGGGAAVATVTLSSVPGTAARANFAPRPGQRRGAIAYVDPYTGAAQPALRAYDAFEWIERLHRWLLLPRDTGKPVTGALAGCLLLMALSGLYLRWPRRPRAWRSWLTFDTRAQGRGFLRGLHATIGTVVLVVYLVSTSTGLYWGFDTVKDAVDGWVGATKPGPAARADGGPRRATGDGATPLDLCAVWATFTKTAGAWETATLRLPERAGQPVQITWLAADAPHERARNRMSVLADGALAQDARFAAQPLGDRLVALVLPLHTGTALGWPGRLAMMLAALMLPVFAVTGWGMYLKRRGRGPGAAGPG